MADTAFYTLIPVILFWLAAAAVWGSVSYGIYMENRQIKEEIPTLPTLHYFLTRLQALQRRNLQLWCVMSFLFAVCAVNSLYDTLRPPIPPAAVLVQQAPVQAKEQQPVPEKQPVPVASNPAPNTASHPVPATNSLPYSDITEFNEKDSKQQAMIDWLKQRYENTLITYYYLQKCGLADKSDFDVIRASLHKELADLNTETSSAEDNILLAANGSYNELYANASCADDRTKVTKSSYDTFMQQLRHPQTAPAANNAPTGAGTPSQTP